MAGIFTLSTALIASTHVLFVCLLLPQAKFTWEESSARRERFAPSSQETIKFSESNEFYWSALSLHYKLINKPSGLHLDFRNRNAIHSFSIEIVFRAHEARLARWCSSTNARIEIELNSSNICENMRTITLSNIQSTINRRERDLKWVKFLMNEQNVSDWSCNKR